MTFDNNAYVKIIKHLGLSMVDETQVQSLLATAESKPEVEAEISEILNQIDLIGQTLFQNLENGNLAMTRADVVEWDNSAREQGLFTALNILRTQLASLLGLEYKSNQTISSGTTSSKTRVIY